MHRPLLVSGLAAFALLTGAACGGCPGRSANPPGQDDALRANGPFTPTYADDLPVTFSRFSVSVVGPTNSTLGAQGKLTFDDLEALHRAAAASARAVRPDLPDGTLAALTVRFRYTDRAGQPAGEEQVRCPVGRFRECGVTLRQLGRQGEPPYTVAADVVSVSWRIDPNRVEDVPLVAP